MSRKKLLLLSGLYIAIAVLCAVFVNSHDDYFVPDTGTGFIGSIQYSLTMGNGRYIGNVLGTYLPVRYVPNLIVRSVFLFAMVVLAAKSVTDFSICSICMAAVLILFPDMDIYMEGYQWAHGFYNYAPPVVMLLAGMELVKNHAPSTGRNIMLAALGICQSLFVENATVVMTFMAALMIADAVYKKKEATGAVVYFIASMVGTAIMFFGPKLAGLGGSLGWYRGVAMPGNDMFIPRLIVNLREITAALGECYVMFAAFYVLLLIRQWKQRRRGCWLLLGIMPAAFISMQLVAGEAAAYSYLTPALSVMIISFFAAVLSATALVCCLFDKGTLYDILIPTLGAGASVAELLFVQPIGARCLVITYVLLALTIMRMWECELAASDKMKKICCTASAAAIVAILAVLIPLQTADFKAYKEREAYIISQLEEGKTEISIFGLPYPNIVYKADKVDFYGFTFNCGDIDSMTFVLQDSID